jgi:hypothetical protein
MTRRFAASWRFGRAWFLRIIGNVAYGALQARHLQRAMNISSLDNPERVCAWGMGSKIQLNI